MKQGRLKHVPTIKGPRKCRGKKRWIVLLRKSLLYRRRTRKLVLIVQKWMLSMHV